MRIPKSMLAVVLVAVALIALFATNVIAVVAQSFYLVSVIVFVGTSLLGLAAKLRA